MFAARWRQYVILLLSLLVLTGMLNPFDNKEKLPVINFPEHDLFDELTPEEIQEEKYYRMVDEEGNTIMETGRRMRRGDAFIAEDNRLYEVFEVEDNIARARYKETVDISLDFSLSQSSQFPSLTPGYTPPPSIITQGDEEEDLAFLIGIYHTHNAESYIPSDGREYIYGEGGIHQVGVAFREALEAKGINVLHSQRLHLPHDRGAYRRSRITAQDLIRQGPDAVFDVHRDAAPLEAYEHEIDGEPVTRVMIVVGRANPNAAVNRKFAYELKGYADKIYPGFLRGVFIAFGGYNQDLSPLNLLLEVGTHSSRREDAERGISFFADVVGFYFYGPEFIDIEERNGLDAREEAERDEDDALPPALYRDAGGVSTAVSGTVIGLMTASLIAALSFFYINHPEAGQKTILIFKESPEYLKVIFKEWYIVLQNLPRQLKFFWKNYPQNLRIDFNNLLIEIKNLPSQVSGFIEDKREAFRYEIMTTPEKIGNLRANFHEGIEFFREEGIKIRGKVVNLYNRITKTHIK